MVMIGQLKKKKEKKEKVFHAKDKATLQAKKEAPKKQPLLFFMSKGVCVC